MLFSEPLMQRYFTSEVIPVKAYYGGVADKTYFRSVKTVSGWFAMAKELAADQSPAGDYFRRELRGQGSWAGLGAQEATECLNTGLITEAVKAFEKAEATLGAILTRAAPELSIHGGGFSIGRYMQGHPKAALYRPKKKLPPKSIHITMNIYAGIEAARIAEVMVRIAKACWEYQLQGGILNLTVAFLHNFTEPQHWNGQAHHGILDIIKIDPTSAAAFASAASGQMYRALSMRVATSLSGYRGDGLPLGTWQNKDTIPFAANGTDTEVIRRLKLQTE